MPLKIFHTFQQSVQEKVSEKVPASLKLEIYSSIIHKQTKALYSIETEALEKCRRYLLVGRGYYQIPVILFDNNSRDASMYFSAYVFDIPSEANISFPLLSNNEPLLFSISVAKRRGTRREA